MELMLYKGRPHDCTPGSSSIMGLANDPENHVQLSVIETVCKYDSSISQRSYFSFIVQSSF